MIMESLLFRERVALFLGGLHTKGIAQKQVKDRHVRR
jgi:hypothetical protein